MAKIGSSSTMEEWLTPREIAEAMKISSKTLYDWRLKGFGPPYVQVRDTVRYRKVDFEAWVASIGNS